MSNPSYVPGVCNIGPAEIRRRQLSGWFGLAATVLIWAAVIMLGWPAWARAVVFFPATLMAVGFLQAKLHFCAGFGAIGIQNMGKSVGNTDTVEQSEYRAKDRRRAFEIIGYSVAVGALIAVVAVIM